MYDVVFLIGSVIDGKCCTIQSGSVNPELPEHYSSSNKQCKRTRQDTHMSYQEEEDGVTKT